MSAWKQMSPAQRVDYDRERHPMATPAERSRTVCDGCDEYGDISLVTILPRGQRGYCEQCAGGRS